MTAHVCWFTSGLDELPARKQRDMRAVGQALAKAGRFSVFEATATKALARTMDKIVKARWFDLQTQGYPWTAVKLTDAGRAALREEGEP